MAGKCLVITFGMAAMKSLENHTIQAKEINSFPHKLVPISGALLRNIMRRLWLTIIGVVGPRTFINNSQDSFAWEWVSTNRPRLLPRDTKSRTSLPYFLWFLPSRFFAHLEIYLCVLAAGGQFLRTRQDDASGRSHCAGNYASRAPRNIAKVIDLGPGGLWII